MLLSLLTRLALPGVGVVGVQVTPPEDEELPELELLLELLEPLLELELELLEELLDEEVVVLLPPLSPPPLPPPPHASRRRAVAIRLSLAKGRARRLECGMLGFFEWCGHAQSIATELRRSDSVRSAGQPEGCAEQTVNACAYGR